MSKKNVNKLPTDAEAIAREYKHQYVFTEHVFLAMPNNEEFVAILVDFGVDNMYRTIEQILKDREWTWLKLKHDGSINIGISGTRYYDTEDLAYDAIEYFVKKDRRLEINSAWKDDE